MLYELFGKIGKTIGISDDWKEGYLINILKKRQTKGDVRTGEASCCFQPLEKCSTE